MITLRPFLLFLLSSASLVAQPGGDEDDLYIPPVLSVLVTSDGFIDSTWGSEALLAPSWEQVRREFTIRTELRETYPPLLPIIFFDPSSSDIPDRYHLLDAAATFDYSERSDLQVHDTYDETEFPSKYYEVLNVIGERMTQFPATTIALQGGYSSEPGEGDGIGWDRSKIVEEYLTSVWRIDSNRITLLTPERRADTAADVFQRQEARRVTISSESWEIHRPLFYRAVAHDGGYVVLQIDLEPKMSPEEITAVELRAMNGDTLLASGSLPLDVRSTHQRWSLLWAIPRRTGYAPNTRGAFPPNVTFDVSLRTRDGGATRSNDVMLPVRIDSLPLSRQEWLTRRERKGARRLTPIPFFELTDTTLSRLQRMMIDRMAAGFIMTPEEKSRRLTLEMWSYAGREEFPDADPALMEVLADFHDANRCFSCEFVTVRLPNGFLPLTPELVGNDEEMEDSLLVRAFTTVIGIDAEKLMISAMQIGNERDRLVEEMTNRFPVDRSAPGDAIIEAVQMRRNRQTYVAFMSRADTTMLSTVEMMTVHPENMPLHLLPERRMYHRSVEMSLIDPSANPLFDSSHNDLDEPEIEEEWDEPDDEAEEE